MKDHQRKCFKCGSSPAENSDTTLFRFPKPGSTNSLRCELWAKYCCPDKPWSNKDFQLKLYSEHRMLCHRHFKETSFVDFPLKKLRRFASPDAEDITMPFLQVEVREPIAGSPQPLSDTSNKNYPSTFDVPASSKIKTVNLAIDKNYLKCKKYLEKVCLLKKKFKQMKNKEYLNKLDTDEAVNNLTEKISANFALLLQSQIRNFKKNAKGRRWNLKTR